ncbi:MAG: sulfotransferase [Sphingobacteriales bacterium]|nr:sulfotransferase [Sphingobacteriales bacterium]
MENYKRLPLHQKNQEVEDTLAYLAKYIIDPSISETYSSNFPKIFIMGCARSGTTLLAQFLAQYTKFCYPSNLISRFYYAPKIGALLQKLFFDLDIRKELLGDYDRLFEFESDLGKTQHILSPNEFWYFWRRFFTFNQEIQQLTVDELKKVDFKGFEQGLESIQQVYKAPIFLKGMMLNWHIPELIKNLDNAFIIFTERNLAENAQSILEARNHYFGNYNEWFSFKPEEYDDLKKLSPIEQVIGQVYYTNNAIKEGLKQISNKNYIHIQHEDFCANPNKFLNNLFDILNLNIDEFGTASKIPHFTKHIKQIDNKIKESALLYDRS